MIWEISLLIISIALLLLVAFFIPTLVQIRRTAARLEQVAEPVSHQLPALLTNLDEITTNLSAILSSSRRQIEVLGEAANEVKELVDDVVNMEKNIKNQIEAPVTELAITLNATAKAVRAFLNVFRSRD